MVVCPDSGGALASAMPEKREDERCTCQSSAPESSNIMRNLLNSEQLSRIMVSGRPPAHSRSQIHFLPAAWMLPCRPVASVRDFRSSLGHDARLWLLFRAATHQLRCRRYRGDRTRVAGFVVSHAPFDVDAGDPADDCDGTAGGGRAHVTP